MPRFLTGPSSDVRVIRNPVLIEVSFGCLQHGYAVLCSVVKDGDTGAMYHLPAVDIVEVEPPAIVCSSCDRADGRCEFASTGMIRALVAAGMTVEQVHERGKEALRYSLEAAEQLDRGDGTG